MTVPADVIAKDQRFIAIHEAREAAAAEARKLKADFTRWKKILIVATVASAVFGGLVLYSIGKSPDTTTPADIVSKIQSLLANPLFRGLLLILQAAALVAVAYYGTLLSTDSTFDRYVARRMEAEKGRLDRATAALEIGHAAGTDAFASGAAYFKAELIDGQLAYLKKAGETYGSGMRIEAKAAASIAALGAGASALAAFPTDALKVVAAFMGILAPALMSALKSWQESAADKERAALARSTWSKLNDMRAQAGRIDDAVKNNDLSAAKSYADEVKAVLQNDHQAFESLTKPKDTTIK